MKEFGLYVLKPNYIAQFSTVDASLQGLKGATRPFVCIKISLEKQNWVIPIASLNPAAPDYNRKLAKYSDFYKLDKEQAKRDNRPYARAITIFKDLTGLQSDPNFQSVVEYYNALPVKHKYCKKYRDKSGKHIVITDEQTRTIIKRVLKENMAARVNGEEVGFIKAKIEAGRTNFSNYPKKSLQIREELYKEHIALKQADKEKKVRAQQRSADDAKKRALRVAAKGTQDCEKIEIEPLRVFKQTESSVLVKLPGARADEKNAVWLPNDGIMLDKEGAKVIGIREDLQQKYSLKMPQGQPKRFLK